MRVICVAGARPNFVKVKPVLAALEARGVDTVLVHTGQHYDQALSASFFTDLDLRAPDRELGVGSGTHAEQTARVLTRFEPVVAAAAPDAVVVVGDVNSTVACALVAAKAGARVAHVEAGLRSRDWTMPEEINRVVTDRLSDELFAPSTDAVANLQAEGYRPDQIHLVGNTMIDTLLACRDRAAARLTALAASLGVAPGRYGLVTLHRPANVDDAGVLASLVAALGRVGTELPLLFAVHPRTRHTLDQLTLPRPDRLRLLEPLGYLDFLALQLGARLVLTDSGGIQEETTALGVACLTLRPNTERPITVSEGTNTVVGTDPARIVAAARAALERPVEPRKPALWDGRAGERIADVLVERLGQPAGAPRPTGVRGPNDEAGSTGRGGHAGSAATGPGPAPGDAAPAGPPAGEPER